MANDDALVRALRATAHTLSGSPRDLDPLLELTRDAHCVLIGEASHGTHEFYRLRAELTQRLIEEQGFVAVAAEADWPDAYRVNRYVRAMGFDTDAEEALGDFRRFPAWMWRNADVLDFVGWLREYNDARDPRHKVGFYGLDLYSLHASISAVLAYLDRNDRAAATRARERYGCFEHFGDDVERYGYVAGLGLSQDCERQVLEQLIELQKQRDVLLRRDGVAAEDDYFQAEQNARVVKNAEQYYRSMFGGRTSTWNLRDTHMADTLDALSTHLAGRFDRPKVVVWAHNSHVGDARATEVGSEGEINIGQLARTRHPDDTVLIGFSTYTGTVTAASSWGGPAERKRVQTGLPGSFEELFHRVGLPCFLLRPRDIEDLSALASFHEPRLQRAIGVVYKPETERLSHYYHVTLPRQFDAIIHLDHTRSTEPLERTTPGKSEDAPETYPSGM
jgi:erythromycin esterase-like protein